MRNAMLALILLASPAYADATRIGISATVVNAADITGGVISGTQPVQSDVIEGYIIWSF